MNFASGEDVLVRMEVSEDAGNDEEFISSAAMVGSVPAFSFTSYDQGSEKLKLRLTKAGKGNSVHRV